MVEENCLLGVYESMFERINIWFYDTLAWAGIE